MLNHELIPQGRPWPLKNSFEDDIEHTRATHAYEHNQRSVILTFVDEKAGNRNGKRNHDENAAKISHDRHNRVKNVIGPMIDCR